MSTRILASLIGALALVVAGCAHHENVWIKRGATSHSRERDLAIAEAEATRAYPDAKAFLAKAKTPEKAEEQLHEMRHEVVNLWMVAHGWQLVYFDRGGHAHAAHH